MTSHAHRRLRTAAAVLAAACCAALLVAGTAAAAVSLYTPCCSLAGGVAYNSIQRDWNGNALVNSDTQNIGVGRIWAQSPTAGRILDVSEFVPAGQVLYRGYAYQQARNWCESSNTRQGACGGYY